MIIAKQKDLLKFFIKNSNHAILHENYNNKECFFIMVNIKDVTSAYTWQKLKEYESKEHFTKHLQPNSQNYFLKEESNIIFIYVDSIKNDDSNYVAKEKLIRKNYKNIISQKILNEIIDIPTHLEQNINHYLSLAKNKFQKFL